MIQFKVLTVRNFLSVGAITQTVNFTNADLTLILGENLDLGGAGARNGVGKSAALQALCYALFGESMNGIRKDNLINRTNAKAMLVTLDFSVNGVNYRIERGRKPNIMRLFVNNSETGAAEDDAQGENRETQRYIEQILNLTPDMFKMIVCLNTYTVPFLSMKAADQRAIIEQLLGITLLSEKADKLREEIKNSKELFTNEEFRIKTLLDSNSRIQTQIAALQNREAAWRTTHAAELQKLNSDLQGLKQIDITAELQQHAALQTWNTQKTLNTLRDRTVKLSTEWHESQAADLKLLEAGLTDLERIDITAELVAHKNIKVYQDAVKADADHKRAVAQVTRDLERENKHWAQLDTEVQSLLNHRCYACGSELHDDAHTVQLQNKQALLAQARTAGDQLQSDLAILQSNPVFVPSKPVTFYATETEALQHDVDLKLIRDRIRELKVAVDPYADQLAEIPEVVLGEKPVTHYATEAQAVEHQQRVKNTENLIAAKQAEVNPYTDQILDMQANALAPVDYTVLNEVKSLWDHQKFLLDLLTNRDSFIRKRIIDQSLLFLNSRLSHYLQKLGLPHTVIFNNDLSVEITEWGRELDFGNLSRGESNRLILGLSFAFRDVWQNLYHDINCLFIDEILDSGMDSLGFESGIALLKEFGRRKNRHVFLVSHREELIGRMPNILKVYKNNGFTEYVSENSK